MYEVGIRCHLGRWSGMRVGAGRRGESVGGWPGAGEAEL